MAEENKMYPKLLNTVYSIYKLFDNWHLVIQLEFYYSKIVMLIINNTFKVHEQVLQILLREGMNPGILANLSWTKVQTKGLDSEKCLLFDFLF